MDMSELLQAEEEDDYTLQEFFPKTIPYHLQPLSEHRVKLLTKEDIVFHGGDIKLVNTCCVLNKKIKGTKLSMFLIPSENMPLVFESGGYVSESFKGRIVLKLVNYYSRTIKLQCGSCIGYLVLKPYSLELI